MAVTTSEATTGAGEGDGLSVVADAVEAHIATLLGAQAREWGAIDERLGRSVELLADYVLCGGKRLRPAFCTWGHVAAGGDLAGTDVLDAAAALELLHAFALLHDDVMDGAELRRGQVAMHRRLAAEHADAGWHGEDRRFGDGMAILLGDLAFAYADRLVSGSSPDARRVWDELKIELTMGQFLDVQGAASGQIDTTLAVRIAAYKSGRYTVVRPLQLGAALAGGLERVGDHLEAYGAPLGEAFQLRDDLLGVFGDPDETGKPVGDDLREGKPTLLLAEGLARATGEGRRLLERAGESDLSPADVDEACAVLERCGARAAVETAIDERVGRSLEALERAPLEDTPRRALRALADRCTRRAT